MQHQHAMAQSKRHIQIFDTTLRDGEQAPGASLHPEEKIRIAKQLIRLGVDTIEPGFPVSSPGEFAAVQAISQAAQGTGVEICGFARAVREDIDSAVRATEAAEKRRLHLFISSSDIHLDFQLKKSREQVIEMARRQVAYAKKYVDAIEFSPMDASRSGMDFLFQMIEAVIAEGATIINIPDTVGFALPHEYGEIFRRVRREVSGADQVAFSAHCHNDLGFAVANSLAAIQAGASIVEVTVNGVGERAGNCSLEELVMAISTRSEALGMTTGIRPEEIYATSQMVSRAMHFPIAYNKPIVGRNAFQHEAGIHQDGLLKHRQTYEIMDPEALGIPRNMIVLGKHSGRHAIKHRVEQFGIHLHEEQLETLYHTFKAAADRQKMVTDDELLRMVDEAASTHNERYTLMNVQVVTGTQTSRMASVTVKDQETAQIFTYSGTGAGPVEALVASMKQAIPLELNFDDLELHSIASGEHAAGEAVVTLASTKGTYRGIGLDQDIIVAVAKAYMAAGNQAVRAEHSSGKDSVSGSKVYSAEGA